MNIEVLDLNFQGTPHVIASFLVRGPGGCFLIETGPGSTQPALHAALAHHGLEPSDIRDVLVTHIHLDHAGAAGWWAQNGARVHVHPNGARHLIDPGKLITSASRIYGERMETLWGEILPAPEEKVNIVGDGAVLEIAGVSVQVIDTPGHARHHHVFRIDDVAFTGDAAGILIPGQTWVDLPAPPPEFDLEAWKVTLDKLRALGVATIYRTHFGGSSEVDQELDRLEQIMEQGAGWIREMCVRGAERSEMVEVFSGRMRDASVAAGLDSASIRAYELANPREMSVDGIARYWAKRLPSKD